MSRSRTSLDGEWEFYPDPHQQLTQETLRQADARSIRVPGPWQAQFDDLRDYTGVAWYRRLFEADGRTDGQAVGTRVVGESGADESPARPPDRLPSFLTGLFRVAHLQERVSGITEEWARMVSFSILI